MPRSRRTTKFRLATGSSPGSLSNGSSSGP
ncbi:hypothetical protein CPLU01_03562, partial [Colletotrichum plurivorum]